MTASSLAARTLALAWALLLGACAGLGGNGLVVGESTLANIEQRLGAASLSWQEADGSRRLAYSTGPFGVRTYMLTVGRDGRLAAMESVLGNHAFARIRPGMDQEQVLRTIGPPVPAWTVYFPARDELVWEWRYCDEWNQLARFDVLFDRTRGLVRSTMTQREAHVGSCGMDGSCWCSP